MHTLEAPIRLTLSGLRACWGMQRWQEGSDPCLILHQDESYTRACLLLRSPPSLVAGDSLQPYWEARRQSGRRAPGSAAPSCLTGCKHFRISAPQFSHPNNGDNGSADLPDARRKSMLRGRALGTGKSCANVGSFYDSLFPRALRPSLPLSPSLESALGCG